MQTNVNTKYRAPENASFYHFSRILDRW